MLFGRALDHLASRQVDGPFGISFDADDPTTILIFATINILIHSFVMVPMSGLFWVVAVLLYGPVNGFLLALSTSVFGCYLGLIATRCFRPFFIRCLGENATAFHQIDRAIVREKWKIPLLVRSTPVMPVVPTNVLLGLTSIDQWTYTWTVTLGSVPSGMPYVYAAMVGEEILNDFPPRDPLLLGLSLVGLVATGLGGLYWQRSLVLTADAFGVASAVSALSLATFVLGRPVFCRTFTPPGGSARQMHGAPDTERLLRD